MRLQMRKLAEITHVYQAWTKTKYCNLTVMPSTSPKNKDVDIEAAQLELASLMMSKQVQVDFNLKKNSLTVRVDVDLSAADDCMRQVLAILANGNMLPGGDMALTRDRVESINDLMFQFWNSDMSAADVQKKYAALIASAD